MLRTLFALILVHASAFAALPTIFCGKGERSIQFEEGIDDFLLDIRDVALKSTPVGAILKKETRANYLLQYRIPKSLEVVGSPPRPNCIFSADKPLLLNCYNGMLKEVGKIKNLDTGEVTELKTPYLAVGTQVVQKESVDANSVLVTTKTVTFALRTYTLGETPQFINIETEFPFAECRVGGDVESPAR